MDILRLKKSSPAIFGAILISFTLPFINISCNGQIVRSLSGKQLVQGTTIYAPEDMFGGVTPHRLNPEPLAIMVFICTVIGLVVSFRKPKKGALICSITSCSGAVLLWLLFTKVKNDALRETGGMIGVSGGAGFWLAFLLFLALGCLNVFLLRRALAEKELNEKGPEENGH